MEFFGSRQEFRQFRVGSRRIAVFKQFLREKVVRRSSDDSVVLFPRWY